ncbi:unnamed protein product [Gongylonema pulchrum]|uniref:Uncharacterized protein n=1 Tax=Gongylonema pulchrum TaxID=637853 RepID=A0A3P6PQT2_9BILA|nr:unnamed protein product [Gongylonema pulchrum]
MGEAKEKLHHARGSGAEAGSSLKDAAKEALTGVKEGVIETAKEVRNKAADVAGAVKTKYRKLSDSFHSSDASHHGGGTSARSIDGVGCGSSIDYGANGGVQPVDASNKAFEVRPGQSVGAGSNVDYVTVVKTAGGPTGAETHTTTSEQVSHSGTKPGTGQDVEHTLKSAMHKGTKEMDDLRQKGSDKISNLQQRGSEKAEELQEKGAEKMGDLRQKGSEKFDEVKDYVGDKLHELGPGFEPQMNGK